MDSRSNSDEEYYIDLISVDSDSNETQADIDLIVTESDKNKELGDLHTSLFNISLNVEHIELAMKHYEYALGLLESIELPSPFLKCCVELTRNTHAFFTHQDNKITKDAYIAAITNYRANQLLKPQGQAQELPLSRRTAYLNRREEQDIDDAAAMETDIAALRL